MRLAVTRLFLPGKQPTVAVMDCTYRRPSGLLSALSLASAAILISALSSETRLLPQQV